ncbi:hypothetical protein [uncultured Mucilaginibacter sp.]|uniref:hypothetical protein n=1 Tax=uncultured Mucilaginibacter sp. TaxID=797541 RepID=UPI0025E71720|nr:hypothetical protein [uncultured Mucilaginibacter sp.]
MKAKSLILIMGYVVVCLAACKKTQLVHPTIKAATITDTTTDVYVAGYVVAQNGNSVAAYWKNGALTRLTTDSADVSVAYGIAVQGNDVYVAGLAPGDSSGTRGYYGKMVCLKCFITEEIIRRPVVLLCREAMYTLVVLLPAQVVTWIRPYTGKMGWGIYCLRP